MMDVFGAALSLGMYICRCLLVKWSSVCGCWREM